MRRERFRAMGTTVSLLLPTPQAGAGYQAVQTLFAEWESALSRFNPVSELSQLNAQAGGPVRVSPLLYCVVATALDAARATEGLFDPTLLRQVVILGYDRSFEVLPAVQPPSLCGAGPGGGWRAVALDPERCEVTLPRGCGLDLGGIAKGLAVDAALACLQEIGVERTLVNAGGDLAVHGLPPDGASWPVTVPTRTGTQTVALQYGALATSSVARRRWRQGRQERHHLLDPRTGTPAAGHLWSVSVGAATCAQADVAAKAAYLLGPVEGARFLSAHHLSGLLVAADGTYHTAGTWPAATGEEGGR
jgi:thiamine biosynthesis lipoprotein